MIVERTQEGKAITREKGIRVDGRPRLDLQRELFQKFREKQKGGKMTVQECCKELNISRTSWYKYLKRIDLSSCQ